MKLMDLCKQAGNSMLSCHFFAEIKESVFRQHFEECGTVEAVRLVRDKNSGLGKGFGYVLFKVLFPFQHFSHLKLFTDHSPGLKQTQTWQS